MKRKLVSLVMAAVMLAALLPGMSVFASAVVDSGECGDGVSWVLTDDGTLVISGSGQMSYAEVPWTYYCEDILTVIIKKGVTNIGEEAFCECINLSSVTIANTVERIEREAFLDCESLKSITIPSSVRRIHSKAFGATEITSIDIPASVISLSGDAFWGCWELTDINVDKANANYRSFDGVLYSKDGSVLICCPGAKSGECEVGSNVQEIESGAFEYCVCITAINVDEANENYSSRDGVLFNKDGSVLICCPGGKSGAYEVPDGVTEISQSAFNSCSSLTDIKIADSVNVIGRNTFQSCSRLINVVLPKDIKAIKSCMFMYCSALTEFIIPDTVTVIEAQAFRRCDNLSSVTVPVSVTEIQDAAFLFCRKLSDIYYEGSEEQWNAIDVGYSNDMLENVTVHFESVSAKPQIVSASAKAENGAVKVTIKAENMPEGSRLIAAGYGEGKEYIASGYADANGIAEIKAEGVTTVKIFLWKSLESMEPLCDAKIIEVY